MSLLVVLPLSSLHSLACLLMHQVILCMRVGGAYHQLTGVLCVELHHCPSIQHWRSDGI